MQCPACGYRLSPAWVRGLRMWTQIKASPPGFPCDGCGRLVRLVPGALDRNGVGDDRLAPVENAEEGRSETR